MTNVSVASSDVIALVSIGSSAVIAVVSVGATLLGARGQRQHDAQLAFESRAWDRKVDAHLELIKVLLSVRKAATPRPQWPEIQQLAKSRETVIAEVQPTLTAYASSQCVQDLENWLAVMGSALDGYDTPLQRLGRAIEDLAKVSEGPVPEGQTLQQTLLPGIERFQNTANDLQRGFAYDRDGVLSVNERLLASTRASLKGT